MRQAFQGLLQAEGVQGVACALQDVLVTAQHIALRGVCRTDMRVPQLLAICSVVGDQITARVRRKHQVACRRRHADEAGSAYAGVTMPPGGLAGFVINCHQIAAQRAKADLVLAAQPHGTAWIRGGQVVHGVAFLRIHVEQAGLWAVCRGRPVDHTAVRG